MSMLKIESALKQYNFIDEMKRIGYTLFNEDKKFLDDYWFHNETMEILIFYSVVTQSFTTYSKRNHNQLNFAVSLTSEGDKQ